ncbi:hypothetical protein A6A10_03340 [Otariodibacter oris]|nr:hypothetical protein A6A10_03340 [Otariodibacter oris]
MSKKKELSLAKNYMYYIGSEAGRSYSESVAHVLSGAKYILDKDHKNGNDDVSIRCFVNAITTATGNIFGCVCVLSSRYEAKASYELLKNSDIQAFKQDLYVAAKLKILADKETRMSLGLFLGLMSDSPVLLNYIKSYHCYVEYMNNVNSGKYKKTDPAEFFFKSYLLAVNGRWNELKYRIDFFFNENKASKVIKYYLPCNEFLLGLYEKDVDKMYSALTKLLDLKIAKRKNYGVNVFFDFYLNIEVLILAKIAALHGFNVNIDHPTAPKELIEYNPLREYIDPYDFMKEYNFEHPHQEWIDLCNSRMEKVKSDKENNRLKNRIFSWFKK